MTFISLKKSLIAALAACTLTASAAAAPSPEAQLDTIASAQEVWKYEFAALCAPDELPFHLRAFDPAETRVAVADLDGSGQPSPRNSSHSATSPSPASSVARKNGRKPHSHNGWASRQTGTAFVSAGISSPDFITSPFSNRSA